MVLLSAFLEWKKGYSYEFSIGLYRIFRYTIGNG